MILHILGQKGICKVLFVHYSPFSLFSLFFYKLERDFSIRPYLIYILEIITVIIVMNQSQRDMDRLVVKLTLDLSIIIFFGCKFRNRKSFCRELFLFESIIKFLKNVTCHRFKYY